MAAKGDIVKFHTGTGKWVPAVVTTSANEDGKQWVTVFPGPHKDDEQLQADACPVLAGPGDGKYEFQEL